MFTTKLSLYHGERGNKNYASQFNELQTSCHGFLLLLLYWFCKDLKAYEGKNAVFGWHQAKNTLHWTLQSRICNRTHTYTDRLCVDH